MNFNDIKNKQEQKKFLIQLRKSGKKIKEISEELGITQGKIKYILSGEGPSSVGDVYKDEIARLRLEGKSYAEIGKQLGIDKASAFRWAKKMGIDQIKEGKSVRILEDINVAKELKDRNAIAGCLISRLDSYKAIETPDDVKLIEKAANELSMLQGGNEEKRVYTAVYLLSKLQNKI